MDKYTKEQKINFLKSKITDDELNEVLKRVKLGFDTTVINIKKPGIKVKPEPEIKSKPELKPEPDNPKLRYILR